MNERIRLLADEAAKFSAILALPTGESGDKLFVEKFAELIVQECAEIAKKVDGNESDDYQSGRTWAGIDVLEHFGVKE